MPEAEAVGLAHCLCWSTGAEARWQEEVDVNIKKTKQSLSIRRQLDRDADETPLVSRARDFALERIVPRYVELFERIASGG